MHIKQDQVFGISFGRYMHRQNTEQNLIWKAKPNFLAYKSPHCPNVHYSGRWSHVSYLKSLHLAQNSRFRKLDSAQRRLDA